MKEVTPLLGAGADDDLDVAGMSEYRKVVLGLVSKTAMMRATRAMSSTGVRVARNGRRRSTGHHRHRAIHDLGLGDHLRPGVQEEIRMYDVVDGGEGRRWREREDQE